MHCTHFFFGRVFGKKPPIYFSRIHISGISGLIQHFLFYPNFVVLNYQYFVLFLLGCAFYEALYMKAGKSAGLWRQRPLQWNVFDNEISIDNISG